MRVSHRNDAYEAVHAQFAWQVPEIFNIAEACCGRWARSPAHQKQTAIVTHVGSALPAHTWSFQDLQAVAYMAVLQMGAVAMPLSMLFGPEALAFRVQDSEASVALCDEVSAPVLSALQAQCASLKTVWQVPEQLQKTFKKTKQHEDFKPARTLADDPAVFHAAARKRSPGSQATGGPGQHGATEPVHRAAPAREHPRGRREQQRSTHQ